MNFRQLLNAGKLKEAEEMLNTKGFLVLLDNGEYM
jgi:hypothetical protein